MLSGAPVHLKAKSEARVGRLTFTTIGFSNANVQGHACLSIFVITVHTQTTAFLLKPAVIHMPVGCEDTSLCKTKSLVLLTPSMKVCLTITMLAEAKYMVSNNQNFAYQLRGSKV